MEGQIDVKSVYAEYSVFLGGTLHLDGTRPAFPANFEFARTQRRAKLPLDLLQS